MSDLGVLQQSRARRAQQQKRARRARRLRTLRFGVFALAITAGTLLWLLSGVATNPPIPRAVALRRTPPPRHAAPYGRVPAPRRLNVSLKLPLRSGLLFDVRTGRVLWQRAPDRDLPIASLTKMMTALVVVAHARPSAEVMITKASVDYSGSGVGLLPRGKRAPLLTLLYGLMLPSGNDAAIALAQHVAGTEGRFVAKMNARARAMGLTCTHFTTVSGIVDQGNYSCAVDLARIAHAVLVQPLLARIVASSSAVLPLPIKGGKVYLYNNNPLLRLGYPGTDGVKTGYTVAAGQCLVAAARRGRRWLGVVLLHSGDTADQARTLLDAGFAARRE